MVIKNVVIDLTEGETSQSDVSGSKFTGNVLNPIVVRKKRKKKDLEEYEEYDANCDNDCDTCVEKCEFDDRSNLGQDEHRLINVEELSVVKRGDKWCVVHGHPMKPGSKTDKPIGSIIHCFPTRKEAEAMHRAIIISKKKRGELSENGDNSEIKHFLKTSEDVTISDNFISFSESDLGIDIFINLEDLKIKELVKSKILCQFPCGMHEKIRFLCDEIGGKDSLFELKLVRKNRDFADKKELSEPVYLLSPYYLQTPAEYKERKEVIKCLKS